MAIRRIPLPWTTVYANSTAVRNCPACPAIGAGAVKKVRVIWEFQGSTDTGELQVGIGFQTADHEDTWTGGTAIGSAVKTQGMQYPTGWTDVSATTGGEVLFRIVWRCSNSAASAVNLGRVAGVLEIDDTTA